MLALVAALFLVGVVLLVASAIGSTVKVGELEIPALTSPAARLRVGLIGALSIALGVILVLVLLLHHPPTSAAPANTTPATNTSPAPSDPPQVTTAPPTTSAPPSPAPPASTQPAPELPSPAVVRERWHGTLVLGGYGGGPGGGWFLDPIPPRQAVTGDLYYGDTNELVSNIAIVAWTGPRPPSQRQCATLLDTRLGQHVADVRVGSMACVRTGDGRVGYVRVAQTPGPNELNPHMTVEATVWER